MKVALVVLTNGRRACIERSIPSFEEYVTPEPVTRVIFDDSGDVEYAAQLLLRFPRFDVRPTLRPLGYADAMRRAFDHVATLDAEWVFVLEDDFLFERPVDLEAMALVMGRDPYLAQVVLRRQAWFKGELRTGDLIGRFPAARFDERDGYLRHRVFWSMNPSLTRRDLWQRFRWPRGPQSERRFGDRIFAAALSVALWGGRHDEPWVTHIGAERVGSNY